ncbi:MAG: hypothetical protein HQK96_21650 [Nitrospirae bacterium]|nr:hypothetical protein [Nitrospirota bacterium]
MSSIDAKEQIDILMKEYGFIKGEMQTYINLFQRHTNFLPLILPTSIAIVSATLAIITKSDTNGLEKIFNHNLIVVFGTPLLVYQLLGFLAFVLITTAGLFSASASLSYMYILELLARRLEKIEIEINKLVGRRLLYWEIGISPKLIRVAKVHGLWIKPSTSRILWSYIVFFFLIAFMILVAKKLIGCWLALGFITYALLGIFFQIVQYVQYINKVIPRMVEIITSEIDL